MIRGRSIGTGLTGTGIPISLQNQHYTTEKGDRHAPDPGELPNIRDLLFLREFDAVAAFACIGIPEDALGNWIDDKPAPGEFTRDERETILRAIIDSETLGLSIIVLLDDAPLSEDPELPALGFRYFSLADPQTGFGIESWEYNTDRTYKSFKIRYGTLPNETIEIPASRCLILRPRMKRPVIYPCYDEIWNLREWRRQMGTRSAERLPARFQFNRQEGTWNKPEKDSVSDAMGDTKYMLTSNVEVKAITGEISDQELVNTLDELRSAIALALRVSVADIRGAEAGQKLSVDSNDTKYARRLLAIQKHYNSYIFRLAELCGRKFDGFPSPWELRDDLKDKSILALADAMRETQDLEIKGMFKALLKRRFRTWYNVDRPEEIEQPALPAFPFGGFQGAPGEDAGGTRNAERRRDESESNRNRKEQQRFPR